MYQIQAAETVLAFPTYSFLHFVSHFTMSVLFLLCTVIFVSENSIIFLTFHISF